MVRISYAQNAEDIVLERLFAQQRSGVYVDVGAGDPTLDSVTRRLSDAGWLGINVEPNPVLYARLEEERPRAQNLSCAVSNENGWADLHVYRDRWGWSTINPTLKHEHAANGVGHSSVRVPVRTLQSILEDSKIRRRFDLLKIDAEGSEEAVLGSINLAEWLPRVVLIEATWPGTDRGSFEGWHSILAEHKYRVALFDGVNRFYTLQDDVEAARAFRAPANSLDDYIPYKWWRLLDVETRRRLMQES